MNKVIEILKSLEVTTSRLEKEKILIDNRDNELLKKTFEYALNPYKIYGIGLKTFTMYTANTYTDFKDIFELLDYLLVNCNGSDLVKAKVLGFLNHSTTEESYWYKRIILKDLRVGVTEKTVNKIWKGLIPVWEIQQAYSIDKAKLKNNEWIALSLKLNGIRSTYFNEMFISRQAKEMIGFDHIKKDIKSIDWLKDFVVDGEMIRKNIDGISDNENFRLTTSIVNSDVSEKPEIEFVIFDLVPKDEFVKGESRKTFKQRLEDLKLLQFSIDRLGLKNIRIAPTYYTGTDHSQIQILLDKVDAEGFEGLMCLRDDKYKCKRHKGILKVKKFKTADCVITGYREGEDKYKGMLGSFVIYYKGNDVSVGSGYTDKQRKEFWEHKSEYIGRILEVKYKEESKDSKTELISLQFPIFICIRENGKKVSYN